MNKNFQIIDVEKLESTVRANGGRYAIGARALEASLYFRYLLGENKEELLTNLQKDNVDDNRRKGFQTLLNIQSILCLLFYKDSGIPHTIEHVKAFLSNFSYKDKRITDTISFGQFIKLVLPHIQAPFSDYEYSLNPVTWKFEVNYIIENSDAEEDSLFIKKLAKKIIPKHHAGNVKTKSQDSQAYSLDALYSSYRLFSIKTIEGFVETRTLIEVSLLKNAIEVIMKDGVEELELTLLKMKLAMSKDDIEKFAFYDMEFHLALSRYSSNKFLIGILDDSKEIFLFQQKLLISMPGVMDAAYTAHERIINSLRNKNISDSIEFMEIHVSKVKKNWLRLLENFTITDLNELEQSMSGSIYSLRNYFEKRALSNLCSTISPEVIMKYYSLVDDAEKCLSLGDNISFAKLMVDFHIGLLDNYFEEGMMALVAKTQDLLRTQSIFIFHIPELQRETLNFQSSFIQALESNNINLASELLNTQLNLENTTWKALTQ